MKNLYLSKMELFTSVRKIINWWFSNLPYSIFIWKSYIRIYLFLYLFLKYFLIWISTWWIMCGNSHLLDTMMSPNGKCIHNDGLFPFCSEFAVQNAVMESGLLLCLIDFPVLKKISRQVMKAGRLCQEKMRMNLNYRVIAVVLKKKTKNYLCKKGTFG